MTQAPLSREDIEDWLIKIDHKLNCIWRHSGGGEEREEDETCRHGKPLHQDCYACDETGGERQRCFECDLDTFEPGYGCHNCGYLVGEIDLSKPSPAPASEVDGLIDDLRNELNSPEAMADLDKLAAALDGMRREVERLTRALQFHSGE